ncbi:MAG: PKD repeat protein [Bacteroidia bacterium]|jgi:PKD repeat protein
MNIKSLSILLINLVALSSTTLGQNHTCGSAQVNNEAIANDSSKSELQRKMHLEALEFTETYANNRGGIKIIPVVIHVMHNGGDENITKDQVDNAIEIINEDFRLMNDDSDQIIPEFFNIQADTQVEFRLAQKDPNGNCTDGVTRTKTELTFDAGENVKNLISWNTSKYLNIWVVDNISIGAGGYAYYPGSAPGQDNEGIVIRNAQFGGIGESNGGNFSRRSLTHEIGHYLNLAHTWGSTNENAVEENCFSDDGVSDTPNTIGSDQNCVLDQASCGSLDNVQNYMDYATCGRMFTMNQGARMNSALNSTDGGSLGYYRRTLWQQSNLIATGTNAGFVNICAPIADFTSDKDQVCPGSEIQFTDQSYNAEVDGSWTWSWSFEGGNPATSDEQNPLVIFNTPGDHSISLTVTNSTGTDSQTYSELISVSGTSSNTIAPFMEGMEYADWPDHPTDPDLDWSVENETSSTWFRTTNAAHSGAASTRINLRNITDGAINSLISQPFNLSTVASGDAKLSFWYAHSARNGDDSSERMRVYVSKNCGENWNIRFSRQGNSLHTTEVTHSNFVPDADEWEFVEFNMTTYEGEPHVLVKFEAMSDRESYLYVDDINIGTGSTGIFDGDITSTIEMFPNPSNGFVNLITRLDHTGISVSDITGKLIISETGTAAGKTTLELSDLPNGIYTVKFQNEEGISIKKLVLNK